MFCYICVFYKGFGFWGIELCLLVVSGERGVSIEDLSNYFLGLIYWVLGKLDRYFSVYVSGYIVGDVYFLFVRDGRFFIV